MRVLITGAAGFVGRHLIPRLATEHEVVALVRALPPSDLGAAKTIVADLTSPSLATRLPKDIDVVVHLAQAYKTFPEHAAEIFAVNAASTQRLADHSRAVGVGRFILASSGSIYSPGPRPHRETEEPRPMGYHPGTKLIAEQLLSYYMDSFDVVALRLFAPYGAGQTDRLIPRLVDAVRRGETVYLSRGGEPRINPIFIDDLVEVFAQGVAGSGTGIINVAGPTPVSIRDIAEIAGRVLGRTPQFIDRDQGAPGDLIADTTRMRESFEIDTLVDLREGLPQAISGETR